MTTDFRKQQRSERAEKERARPNKRTGHKNSTLSEAKKIKFGDPNKNAINRLNVRLRRQLRQKAEYR